MTWCLIKYRDNFASYRDCLSAALNAPFQKLAVESSCHINDAKEIDQYDTAKWLQTVK